jgi:hypothetical protein
MTFNVPPPPPADEPTHEERVAQLTALIRRHRELGAEVAGLTEERKAIQATVAELTQPGWKLVVDGVSATHREANRTFSLARALEVLPAEIKAQCVDKLPRFDPKMIREAVEQEGLLDECMEIDEARSTVVKLA